MYQVYCDNLLMYHPSINALKIKTPKVNLEVNKTGTFDFQIFPTHPYYNDLKRLKSIIKVYQDDNLLFRGRIIDDQAGFYNQKQVTCEGELAFLLDSIQRPYNYTGDLPEYFAQLITSHNSQVDAEHQFKVGNVTVTDPNGYINRSDTTYQNTFNAITTKLIETHGGYLWVRHEADGNYLDYIDDFTTVSNQPVEFGKNLLDITKKTKGADIATAIIPLGAKLEGSEDRVTIVSVNGGVDYVYSPEAVSIYGWIFKVQTWDDVTVPANLLTKANEYLTSAVNISTEIELSAVDLSALNTSVDAFHLGNYVTVHTTPHGIDQNFFVNKLTLDLTNPKSNKLTLGTTFSSFTEQTIASEKVTQKLIESVSSGARQDLSLYNTAVQRLTSLITNSFGVYKTEQEVEGGSVIYYLHDKSTLEASETIWKMTADAFAVSTDGGDTWNAGFDAQGNAVFNVLNAIGINAEWIKAGTISSIPSNVTFGPFVAADVTRAQQIYVGNITPTETDLTKYDINRNGVIDLKDIVRMNQAISRGGTITYSFEIKLSSDDPTKSVHVIARDVYDNSLVGETKVGFGGIVADTLVCDRAILDNVEISGTYSGQFTTHDGKTVVVSSGVIMSVT